MLERLRDYCLSMGKAHPEFKHVIQDCFDMAVEEVELTGSETHETELAISFIDSAIKRG
jgi:hypothetical protein